MGEPSAVGPSADGQREEDEDHDKHVVGLSSTAQLCGWRTRARSSDWVVQQTCGPQCTCQRIYVHAPTGWSLCARTANGYRRSLQRGCSAETPDTSDFDARGTRVQRAYDSVQDQGRRSTAAAAESASSTTPTTTVMHDERLVRSFHNWIKAALMELCVDLANTTTQARPLAVLDVAGGKGGDMLKWKSSCAVDLYACVDISPRQIRDAVQRYTAIEKPFPRSAFVVADVRRPAFWAALSSSNWARKRKRFHADDTAADHNMPNNNNNNTVAHPTVYGGSLTLRELKGHTFDIVSLQFSLHYLADEVQTLRTLFAGIRACTHPHSVIYATLPDERSLYRLYNEDAHRRGRRHAYHHPLFDITFSETFPVDRRYTFRFGHQQVPSVDEFLTPLALVDAIAHDYNFQRVPSLSRNMWSFARHVAKAHPTMAHRLFANVCPRIGRWDNLPEAVQHVTPLYRTLVYQRLS